MKLEGLSPLLFVEIEGQTSHTVLYYGYLDMYCFDSKNFSESCIAIITRSAAIKAIVLNGRLFIFIQASLMVMIIEGDE
jgi:hypothetical protein